MEKPFKDKQKVVLPGTVTGWAGENVVLVQLAGDGRVIQTHPMNLVDAGATIVVIEGDKDVKATKKGKK